MAITRWWLGHATETTAVVVIRSDSTETYTLACDGTEYSMSADTGVNDGCVAATVSGLSAGASYGFTVGGVSGTLKTMPGSGGFKFGWFSCYEIGRNQTGLARMAKHEVAATCTLGDTPYTENSGDPYGMGYVAASAGGGQTQANLEKHHRGILYTPGYVDILQFAPHYKGADDHEWPGDNWDHNPDLKASGTATCNSISDIGTTQAEIDAIYVNARSALDSYSLGNPPNSDTDAVAQKPPSSSLTDASYPPRYCRWTIQNCEFFLLDCISHRDYLKNADTGTYPNHDKTMLGSQQRTWLLNRLAASQATFKIILSPKRVWDNDTGTGNEDAWGDYATERDGICQAYTDAGVTGVVWLTGDQHVAQISASVSAADATAEIPQTGADTFSVVDVCACPLSVNSQGNITTVTQNRQFFNAKSPRHHVFGILRAPAAGQYIEPQIWDANTGELVWCGRIYSGENRLTYHDAEVSI